MIKSPPPDAGYTSRVWHDSPIGQWELVSRVPEIRLRPYVQSIEGYRESRATQTIRRRELPWPGVVLIINFGPPWRLTDPRLSARPAEYDSFLAGVYDSYVITESVGLSCCMQVNFTPLGARLFLQMPMSELANRTVRYEEIAGRGGADLAAELYDAPDWDARFTLLESVLRHRIGTGKGACPKVTWAWQQLQRDGDNRPIASLATELGWSHRHLIAAFREQIGLAPRTLARIVRFHRAIRLLDGVEQVRWVEIAHRAGYYDQAHFNRDFRELAGAAPGEFLRRTVPGSGVLEP